MITKSDDKEIMKSKNSEIFIDAAAAWEDMGDGVTRQIMGWDKHIMMVKVKFKKGAIGTPHQHFHSQTTYCNSGKFEFTINGDKQVINPGDGLYIEPNVVHGAVCLEEGMLIDVFSPAREDFLDK